MCISQQNYLLIVNNLDKTGTTSSHGEGHENSHLGGCVEDEVNFNGI